MKFCEQCGTELANEAKFCGKCGSPSGSKSLVELAGEVTIFQERSFCRQILSGADKSKSYSALSKRKHFEDLGSEVVQHGMTATGNEFIYLSGNCGLPYLEFVDPNESMAAFFTEIAEAAALWDGIDAIHASR